MEKVEGFLYIAYHRCVFSLAPLVQPHPLPFPPPSQTYFGVLGSSEERASQMVAAPSVAPWSRRWPVEGRLRYLRTGLGLLLPKWSKAGPSVLRGLDGKSTAKEKWVIRQTSTENFISKLMIHTKHTNIDNATTQCQCLVAVSASKYTKTIKQDSAIMVLFYYYKPTQKLTTTGMDTWHVTR